MNLVKAADDIKNLSDQQLLSAGQNPVMVPPYLVLAEMKRREQLRAQYAKSQQQQQQPSVAQQVAQNLTQPQMGQPQQGAPQQPPPQGIMQAAPPQAMAMAQGGHVARYAEGGKRFSIEDFIKAASGISKGYQDLMPAPAGATVISPNLALSVDQLRQQSATKPVQDYLKDVESLYGKRDYTSMEDLVRQQMEQAKSRKPRIGDALIAAGAAMASNRDPRVGLTNLVAQAIGTGSQTYEAAKERQQKDLQAGMMAKVALDKMKQEEQDRRIGIASQMAQADSGRLISAYQTVQANLRSVQSMQQRAATEAEKRRLEMGKAQLESQSDILKMALQMQTSQDTMANQRAIAGMKVAASKAKAAGQGSGLSQIAKLSDMVKSEIEVKQKLIENAPFNSPQRQALQAEIDGLAGQLANLNIAAQQQAFGGGIAGAIPVVNPRFSKAIGQR
jgi:hypothetical protein